MGRIAALGPLILFALVGCATTVDTSGARAGRPLAPTSAEAATLAPGSKLDSPPRRVSGDAPVYPVQSLIRGGTGQAEIEFTVDVDGSTRDFVVISATSESFGVHSVAAVHGWKFEPARRGGQPVAVRARQTFDYTLR